ncbi:hypothetical protein FS749_006723 [Ceratobasidium sp. UAMH 11750]|nr:hypothetical protein FS749_006723 [Ceratobasidium sp. UAMH 11750]
MLNPWDGLEESLFGMSPEEVRKSDEEERIVLRAAREVREPVVDLADGNGRSVKSSDCNVAQGRGEKTTIKREATSIDLDFCGRLTESLDQMRQADSDSDSDAS